MSEEQQSKESKPVISLASANIYQEDALILNGVNLNVNPGESVKPEVAKVPCLKRFMLTFP